jgi:DMSO/TMAO reductase YedYZ molybdopterin-dependent catalytic subunit
MMKRREFLRVAAGGVVLVIQAACSASITQSFNPRPRATDIPAEPSPSGSASVPQPSVQQGAPTPAVNLAQKQIPMPLELQVTPTEEFYVNTYSDIIPTFNPHMWALGVDGLVENNLHFNFDELRALPSVRLMRSLECIGNPVGGSLISNAWWRGVSLKYLLEKAKIGQKAKFLIIDAADEYFTSFPIDLALTDEAILAYEMNDQPLNEAHGSPLRALIPGLYGQKQPKWITHIEVVEKSEKGYWEKKGWSDSAVIRPNSRFDRPADTNVITGHVGDVFTMTGVAFSGKSGIAKVEVSADEGMTWDNATLTRAPAPYTNLVWTRWGYDWKLTKSGSFTLLVRVTDGDGNGQGKPTFRLFYDAFPNGTNAVHMIIVDVKVT